MEKIVKKIIKLAKEQPNDQTFGNKVRDYINNLPAMHKHLTKEEADKTLQNLINNYYGRNNK